MYFGIDNKGGTNTNAFYIFDPFIKFIIMIWIDTMISVVYCVVFRATTSTIVFSARTLYSEIIRVWVRVGIRNRRWETSAGALSTRLKESEARRMCVCVCAHVWNTKKSIQKYRLSFFFVLSLIRRARSGANWSTGSDGEREGVFATTVNDAVTPMTPESDET